MMCACDEEFGRRFLPHQLDHGTELGTRRKMPVTIGFQKNVCNSCRGIPEEPAPKAPMHGRTSRVRRYYWREISMETIRRFGDWALEQGETDWLVARRNHKDTYRSIEQRVIAKIKDLHSRSPKYVYDEESQSDILAKSGVEIVRLDGTYAKHSGARAALVVGNATCSPEQFAVQHYEKQGYDTLFLESVPFHVLFGVYLWLLIEDPADPKNRVVGFGNRSAFDAGAKGEQVLCILPEDFGTSGYASRRKASIDQHLDFLPSDRSEMLWIFDYWLEPSSNMRQYLWAHRSEDIARARQVVSILPPEEIRRVLRYLVGDYWRRYCGWPDLLVHREDDFFLAEVKSSKDKLSEDQKNWIRGNAAELQLPFKLVKIHRATGRMESGPSDETVALGS